jgi:hypothetical protein
MRAVELVLPRVIDYEIKRHAKNAFKTGCDCEYCKAKRIATAEIGFLSHNEVMKRSAEISTQDRRRLDPWELSKYSREIVRESLRNKHREILKEKLHDEG